MEYSNLWNFVQGLTPGAPLAPADVQIALAPYAGKLVRVLKFKVRSTTGRDGWGAGKRSRDLAQPRATGGPGSAVGAAFDA